MFTQIGLAHNVKTLVHFPLGELKSQHALVLSPCASLTIPSLRQPSRTQQDWILSIVRCLPFAGEDSVKGAISPCFLTPPLLTSLFSLPATSPEPVTDRAFRKTPL